MTAPNLILVEDDQVDAQLFKRALKKHAKHTEITVLTDGQDAIDHLVSNEEHEPPVPQLIVLDIKLPRVLGFDVLRKLREDQRMRDVPVIMMSSSTQQSDIKRAYELGANSFISKPSTYSQLSELMEYLTGFWLKFNAIPAK